MPRKAVWGRKVTKPKEIRLKLPGAGLPGDVLRVSSETRDRTLYEQRKAMFKDLHTRLLFDVLRARQDERVTTDDLYAAYRQGEDALKALVADLAGALLEPQVEKFLRTYTKVMRGKVRMHLTRFVDDHGGATATTAALTAETIEAWLAGLTNRVGRKAETKAGYTPTPEQPVSPATRNRYRISLGVFCSWLERHGKLAVHPIARRRVAKATEPLGRMPAPFTPADFAGYLAAVEAEAPDLAAAFTLLLVTGADVHEVLSRRAHHVDHAHAPVRVTYQRTKTGTDPRAIPVDAETAALLGARFRDLPAEAPLFPDVTDADLWRVHRVARAAIGRPAMTLKDARHVAAITWVRAGVNIVRVSKYLGHASLSQTMRYAHHAPDIGEEAEIAARIARQLRGRGGT